MARNTERESDKLYNARRRFTRAAKRYMNKAKDSVGVTAQRYRDMARDAVEKAAELYERKANIQRSKDFTELANELGVNINEFLTNEPTQRERQRRETLKKESKQVTSTLPRTNMSKEEIRQYRREQEARAILNSPYGSRIYAGLVDIWAKPEFDAVTGELVNHRSAADIDKLITEYYGVDSMMDVIEILEKQVDLYGDPESMERYDIVSLTIVKGLYQ